MPLRFPNLDVLRLAITSGLIPPAIVAAPVEVVHGQHGELHVTPSSALPKSTLQELTAIGVVVTAANDNNDPSQESCAYSHWLQLVPLVRQQELPTISDKTTVLFEVPPTQLAEVASEILRLGNDRQSYRHLVRDSGVRTLLRVSGPPYYTLLRALESAAGGPALPAYIEQRPRAWVQLGYEHPLLHHCEVPPGKWLLLRAPRTWEWLDESPFQELYQALDFELPAVESNWQEAPLTQRLRVPLRLATMAETDDAELWVLEEDAWRQVEQLINSSDNELLDRLAFAVVEQAEQPLVILRLRPSKLPPPVLIFRGLACHRYLNLPNLFIPVGQRLRPPLRRDVVARLLAADTGQIVWLQPAEDHTFRSRSVADAHFRPLSQCVDYVLDRAHEPLAAWVSAHRFDFASFACRDDVARAKPTAREQPLREPAPQIAPSPATSKDSSLPAEEPIVAEVIEAPTSELLRAPPLTSELAQRLASVEEQFRALDTPLESPERQSLWREMAQLNGALQRRFDAALCWTHAYWEEDASRRGDAQASLVHWGASQDAALLSRVQLQQLLNDHTTRKATLIELSAQLIHLAEQGAAGELHESLPLIARLLAEHDRILPVRLAWLAWVALTKLTHGDELALARARDRLLERLFQNGLTAEHDLPGFLRVGSGTDEDRQRILRQELTTLRDRVAEWIVEPPSSLARTRAYADLIFAYGLARLGETTQAERIAVWARQQVDSSDALHHWSVQAFELRISEAASGTLRSQLSPDLLDFLERMGRTERYKADRLRQRSRILEPFERIDPYRRWHRTYSDDLSRELALLFDITSREELQMRLESLLKARQAKPAAAARVLTTTLELAPRLGERFAAGLLTRVFPAWDSLDSAVDRAWLLEKALQVAAHFDERDAVAAYVERFETSLPEIIQSYLQLQVDHSPSNQAKLTTIESLFNQSLRGLRKLGLRDEINRIFARIVEVVHKHSAAISTRPKSGRPAKDDPTRATKLMLTVAGGWFYFGNTEQARPIIDDVRQQLFTANVGPVAKSSLACAYVAAVSQAPLEYALPHLEQLFQIRPDNGERYLAGVLDPFTTSSHYSLAQLDVVEATVLALVSEETMLSQEMRRWLEEDEYLVRRRIHRDVRQMAAQAVH